MADRVNPLAIVTGASSGIGREFARTPEAILRPRKPGRS